ncbi:DUF2970 domain-containing protein [Pseudomonas turukhanskensis]|uniref:DUF2970 domain-containing protein n=1 Tax=Pseudomonas turukhanskensis TaxID=1806536 RepID=A0A9W6K9V1_9PSED|nr:DUF2970 domain-containing protein [Pseudomonas turukhanskensis]GLK89618.1 hypothetical protein GCM10017655_26800 [Pseudomonas turukhanskensis]
MDDPDHLNNPNDQPPTLWQVLHSVVAAAFGVQSGKNRARDFRHGKPSHFIFIGVLFTGLFVLVLFALVKLVLHLAGL